MIEAYFGKETWQEELKALRALALQCDLEETVKWRSPCYMSGGRNVALLGRFKNDVRITFVNGVLLPDEEGLLEKAGKDTRTVRVIRFRSLDEIRAKQEAVLKLLRAAIDIETAGIRPPKTELVIEVPEELEAAFADSPDLQTAFHALTPGRQRAYCMHFGGAKQAKSRIARIERYRGRIMDGKGLHDCVCGLSKRMPGCDGSHSRLGAKKP